MGSEGVPGVDGDPGPEVSHYLTSTMYCTISLSIDIFCLLLKGPQGDRGAPGPDGAVGFPVSKDACSQ